MKLESLPNGSPDCPLIRLYDFTPTEAQRLLDEISRLANGTAERVALHELAWVEPVGDCRLTLCVRGWFQAVVRTGKSAEFECGFPAGEWDNVAGLIEPFAEGSGGYQWLAGVPGEASVLLSPSGRW